MSHLLAPVPPVDRQAKQRAVDLAALLDLAFDAVIVTELDSGRVRFWNGSAERLYGWSCSEALGQVVHELLASEFPQNLESIHCLLEKHHVWEGEIQHRARDGRRIIVASRWALQFATPRETALVLEVNSDITERRRAEEEARLLRTELERRVEQRTAELEAANKELEAFTYSVSHDLRQPLRGLDGYSQALLDDYGEALDEEARHYITAIRQATKQLDGLIDDLLRLSRVSRAPMRREKVSLTDLARPIVNALRAGNPERSVEVVIADGLDAVGDRALLEIVLRNLLENAWKFTSKHPTACIEVGSEERDGERLFFVRDDGAGFNPRYAHQLFVPFQRLHRATEFPGTGIGLITVQRIIHRHHGRVWAEGEMERGATLSFTLGTEIGAPPAGPPDSGR